MTFEELHNKWCPKFPVCRADSCEMRADLKPLELQNIELRDEIAAQNGLIEVLQKLVDADKSISKAHNLLGKIEKRKSRTENIQSYPGQAVCEKCKQCWCWCA